MRSSSFALRFVKGNMWMLPLVAKRVTRIACELQYLRMPAAL